MLSVITADSTGIWGTGDGMGIGLMFYLACAGILWITLPSIFLAIGMLRRSLFALKASIVHDFLAGASTAILFMAPTAVWILRSILGAPPNHSEPINWSVILFWILPSLASLWLIAEGIYLAVLLARNRRESIAEE
jgi:hypothetical protein